MAYSTSGTDTQQGYANIMNLEGTAHMSVEVVANGTVSHTELIGGHGQFTYVDRVADPRTLYAGPILLPDARSAIAFAEGNVGKPYSGLYNVHLNSCYTYCGAVLRAGGLNVPNNSLGFSRLINGYRK